MAWTDRRARLHVHCALLCAHQPSCRCCNKLYKCNRLVHKHWPPRGGKQSPRPKQIAQEFTDRRWPGNGHYLAEGNVSAIQTRRRPSETHTKPCPLEPCAGPTEGRPMLLLAAISHPCAGSCVQRVRAAACSSSSLCLNLEFIFIP